MLLWSLLDITNFKSLKELESLIIQDKIILARDVETQQKYEQRMNSGLEINKSNSELARADIFLNRNIGHDGLVLNPNVILCRNKFPVNLPPNTEHWNLWFDLENITEKTISDFVDLALSVKKWKRENAIIWEKKPHHRSVPNLRHLHIYIFKNQNNSLLGTE